MGHKLFHFGWDWKTWRFGLFFRFQVGLEVAIGFGPLIIGFDWQKEA